jgi:hypothetical protein
MFMVGSCSGILDNHCKKYASANKDDKTKLWESIKAEAVRGMGNRDFRRWRAGGRAKLAQEAGFPIGNGRLVS